MNIAVTLFQNTYDEKGLPRYDGAIHYLQEYGYTERRMVTHAVNIYDYTRDENTIEVYFDQLCATAHRYFARYFRKALFSLLTSEILAAFALEEWGPRKLHGDMKLDMWLKMELIDTFLAEQLKLTHGRRARKKRAYHLMKQHLVATL